MAVINFKYTRLLPLLLLFLFVRCAEDRVDLPDVEDCENYDYQDCNTTNPVDAEVKFNFSINKQIHYVSFEVYKGTIDDGTFFFADTAFSSDEYYMLPVDEYYSAIATYHLDGKVVKVIDGGKLRKSSKKVCDSTCWAVNKLSMDLILH